MLKELKRESNKTFTENGAVTYSSSMSNCLDLFATCGAMRRAGEQEIIDRFVRAYAENPDIAMKILFYARDIRGGLGERKFFRVILKYLCVNHPESVKKNIEWIANYGRFDDFLEMMDTPCEAAAVKYLKNQLLSDLEKAHNDEPISLCAKWLPSINTSNSEKVRLGRRLAKKFGMHEKDYRKNLSMLRKRIEIVENFLREEDYTFDYEKVPSKAALKYRNAFFSHDSERYGDYLNKVNSGEKKMNTSTLMPYEIVAPFYGYNRWFQPVSDEEAFSLNTTWNALPDYTDDTNALVVIDTSGSMLWNSPGNPLPMTVATSLGLYFAERTKGEFRNHFILFSTTPQLIEIKGSTLQERLKFIATYNEVADTNMEAVFDLILDTATNNKVPAEDLPSRIFIVSDMEFNEGVENADLTIFESAKLKYKNAGYELPKIVFWNVASRKQQLPVTMNEQGVTLVSGCNARLFEQVMCDSVDPYDYMLEIVNSERYQAIVA